MSDLRLTRQIARGDLRAEGVLRTCYQVEVLELVGLVLAGERIPIVVDRVFEVGASHLRLGVRPDELRTWILVLARELALAEARENEGPVARPAEDWGLLPFERTLLHLRRRSRIGLDELAAALSVDLSLIHI